MKIYLVRLSVLFLALLSPLRQIRGECLLIIGDSNSVELPDYLNYVHFLKERLQESNRKMEIFNFSSSSACTDRAELMLDQALTVCKPDILFILLGLNDASLLLSGNQIKANLEKALSKAQKAGISHLILGGECVSHFNPVYQILLEQIHQSLAIQYQCHLINVLTREIMETAIDSFHPSVEGHRKAADILYHALELILTRGYLGPVRETTSHSMMGTDSI